MMLKACVLLAVDRRGESEESGDDETKRKSINGEVDPQQSSTGNNLLSCLHTHGRILYNPKTAII